MATTDPVTDATVTTPAAEPSSAVATASVSPSEAAPSHSAPTVSPSPLADPAAQLIASKTIPASSLVAPLCPMGSSHAAPDEAVRSRSNSAHASELLHAAAAGKSTLVRQLLEEAAMLGRLSEISFERSCSAALFIASQNGHSEVVSALLAQGVNANTAARNGVTPLFVAARNGHREVVGLLLAFTPTDLMGPSLIAAAQQGHDVCVRLILQAGAPADFMQENRVSALWIASQSGKVSVARELLDASADANQRAAEDMPPLFVACQYGHVAVVQVSRCHSCYVQSKAVVAHARERG